MGCFPTCKIKTKILSIPYLMKLFIPLIFLVCLTACNSPKRYEANRKAAEGWLAAEVGSSRGNISGKWTDATIDGWGEAEFVQKGNQISGTLGNYEINGVANGSNVFLALSSDKWYYYSVQAEHSGSVLKGHYAKGFPVKPKDEGHPFEFHRVR